MVGVFTFRWITNYLVITFTIIFANISLWIWKFISCSLVVRRTSFGRRISFLVILTLVVVIALAMSRVSMESNSLFSSLVLDAMVIVFSVLIFLARVLVVVRILVSLVFSLARRVSKNLMFFLVVGIVLFCGIRKLRV